MSYRIERAQVQGSEMEIYLYEPEGAGPHPGLVLCQHIPGHAGIDGDPFTLKTAERYQTNGYAVSVPFLYHWWSKEDDMQIKRDEFNDAQTELDLKAGFDALAALESVDANRIGIVGHCWGGARELARRVHGFALRRVRGLLRRRRGRRCAARGTRPPSI